MIKMKNILKYIASVFLVGLVTLCIYTFVMTDILKKDYVNVFGYTYFVVATGSMSGTIEVDDIIFVKITKNVKTNDIITFKNKDGDIITHRLIQKKGNQYITKGDVNNVADEAIEAKQIIGKVTSVVSPSFILKSIAIFLIVFILLALVNFDNIIKKYILKGNEAEPKVKSAPTEIPQPVIEPVVTEEVKPQQTVTPVESVPITTAIPVVENVPNRLPDTIFMNPKNRYDEPSSGLTVTIAIDAMEELEKLHEKEIEQDSKVEVLEDYDEYVFSYEPKQKKNKDLREKETIDFVVSILKCKKNNIAKARMNRRWLEKYQYIYRLCHLLLIGDDVTLLEDIEKPPFKEIYDYDLDRVGLTQSIRNRIYDMPIYVFLRILTYSVLYNDDEMFDGVYKILKYKTMVDKNGEFIKIDKTDKNAIKQIQTLVSFMQKVSNKFDNKHVFELDKIERLAKISKY